MVLAIVCSPVSLKQLSLACQYRPAGIAENTCCCMLHLQKLSSNDSRNTQHFFWKYMIVLGSSSVNEKSVESDVGVFVSC